MLQGAFSRIVLRTADGQTHVIGRVGHHDPQRAARELSSRGVVVAVRHELMPKGGKPQTVAIHGLK